MSALVTTTQIKELDRIAIEERGISSLELMENAARKVAQAVYVRLTRDKKRVISRAEGLVKSACEGAEPVVEENTEHKVMCDVVEGEQRNTAFQVAVFCGPGNNGGDGIAAARLLMEMGCSVRVFLVGDRYKMTPDALAMEQELRSAGGVLELFDSEDRLLLDWLATCDAVIDAIFGVGLKRPVEGNFLAAIQWINHFCSPCCPVFACDVPSGVDADTGEILGEAVRADVTVTFTYAKPGLYLGEGGPCAGEVRVEGIGIPLDLARELLQRQPERMEVMDHGRYVLPCRPRTAHKGDFGRLFVLAGSEGYTGAPVLAARSAVRTGAGLVFLGVPRDIYPVVAVKCDEAMPFPLPEEYNIIRKKAQSCDVALIGPGLGRALHTGKMVRSLLADLDIPVVLDADGINALAGHIDELDKRTAPTILTPHEGEFQRLAGGVLPIRDRLAAARNFAKAHHCTLVLKGHGTVTAAPDGRTWICGVGNPGMAKGGSGDVLAGMIAALLGQKHISSYCSGLSELTAWGVYYHAKAGDYCAEKLGEYAMTPSDMIEALPGVLKEHEAR